MKLLSLMFLVLSCTVFSAAQTTNQMQHCQSVIDKDVDSKWAPVICSTINEHLARDEKLIRISHDGGFTTRRHGQTQQRWLPGRLQSAIFLETMRMYYKELENLAEQPPQMSIYATPEESDFILNLWPTAREGFCRYHPGEPYLELSNLEAVCPDNVNVKTAIEAEAPPGECNPPATLAGARINRGTSYECRLFSYPNSSRVR